MSEGAEQYVVSCEHARKAIPFGFAELFAGADEVLTGHRGWDPGAFVLARELAEALGAPLFCGKWSRLLIELNRSPDHPQLWSEWSAKLPEAEKRRLIAEEYRTYRQRVEAAVGRCIEEGGRVVHLSVHSFTPVWEGKERVVDIGLLYDPARRFESDWCRAYGQRLAAKMPDLRVCHNQPYLGTDDGFTTALRQQFPADGYAGIEIEVNQKFPLGNRMGWRDLRQKMVAAISRGWGRE